MTTDIWWNIKTTFGWKLKINRILGKEGSGPWLSIITKKYLMKNSEIFGRVIQR